MTLKEENELLKRQIEHYKDDLVAGRYGIKELERLAKEIGEHQDKLIKRYVDEEEE